MDATNDTDPRATAAGELAAALVDAVRDDGTTYVRLDDDAPAWVSGALYAAHGDMLPDDHVFAAAQLAAAELAADPDVEHGEIADGMVPPYNGDRFAWLASHLSRAAIVDDAVDELGGGEPLGIVEQIGLGMYSEALAIIDTLASAIEDRAAELEGGI